MWATQSWMLQPRAALDAPSAAPSWPPAGATVYADFIAGNYYGAGSTQAASWFISNGTIDATNGLYGDYSYTTAVQTAMSADNSTLYMEIQDNGYTGGDIGEFLWFEVSGSQYLSVFAGSGGDAFLYDGIDASAHAGSGHWVANGLNKLAIRHTTTDRAMSVNGSTGSGSSSSPSFTRLATNTLWNAFYGGAPLGYVKKIAVFGSLTDSAMTTLTT